MFDGGSESRPRVSMRGRRRGAEKESLLRRAQQERELRAAERRRLQAAVIVQRFYRGRAEVSRTRVRVRAEWDLKMRDLAKVAQVVQTQTQKRFCPPLGVLMQLLREFLFSKERRDPRRTAMVARLAAAGAEQADFVAQLDCAQLPSATLTIAAFVRVGLQELDAQSEEDADAVVQAIAAMASWLSRSAQIGTSAFAHLVLALTLPVVYPTPTSHALGFHLDRVSTMYRLDAHTAVGERLRELPQLQDALVWPLLGAAKGAARASGASSSQDGTAPVRQQVLERGLESLTVLAFSSPGPSAAVLAKRLDSAEPAMLAALLDRVATALRHGLLQGAASGSGTIARPLTAAELRTLVQIVAGLKLLNSPAVKVSFLRLAGVLLSLLPVRYAAREGLPEAEFSRGRHQFRSSVLERDFQATIGRRTASASAWSTTVEAELLEASRTLLNLVTSDDFLREIPLSSAVVEASQLLSQICLLDTSLLRNTGGAIDHVEATAADTNFSGPILRALAFRKASEQHPLQVLWQHLETSSAVSSCFDAGVADHVSNYPTKRDLGDERTLPVLLTYLVGLSHALIAADDEDFFIQAKPVSVEVSIKTIHLLKRILHTLLWTDAVALKDPHLLAVALVASRLMRQLRERSSRLQVSKFGDDIASQLVIEQSLSKFTDEALWTWPSATVLAIEMNLLRNEISSEEDAVNILQTIDASMDEEDDALDEEMAMDVEEDRWANRVGGKSSSREEDAQAAARGGVADGTDHGAGVDTRITRILRDIPDLLPFQTRVLLFKALIDADKKLTSPRVPMLPFSGSSSTAVRVRRDHIFEDSFRALSQDEVGSKPLKGRIQVTFVNEHGMEEAGIDGGGLLKEWMDAICKEVFDPTYGYFVTTGTSGDSTANQVTPSYASGVLSSEHLDGFRFAGRILGKALYEGILVEPRLASPFINKLLGRYNHVDDLKFLDQGLHKGLMSMKRMALSSREADREAVADLGLNFQTNIEAFGAHHDVSLMPDGENVAVTAQNALQYIHLLAHFKLNVLTKAQSEAVLKGFRELIPVCWLRLFNAPEVQLLIGGDGYHPIDLNDLKAHCAYSGGYHPSQPYIKAFWQCVDEFTPREHADFLRFITSCSRQPLLGFSSLNPKVCIQKVPHEPYGKLPSAATCMNLLKLPQYDDKETLRSKLLYAISSNAGFDLT